MRRDGDLPVELIIAAGLSSAAGLVVSSFYLLGRGMGIQDLVAFGSVITVAVVVAACAYPWLGNLKRHRSVVVEPARRLDRDHLTGLASRRAFERFAETVFAEAPTSHHAVLLLVPDTACAIRGSLGDAAGDLLTARVAGIVSEALERNTAGKTMVARIDDAEFAALVEFRLADEVRMAADLICSAVRQSAVAFGDENLATTVSVGIGFCLRDTTAKDAVKTARQALERAQADGGDQWRSVAQGGVREISREARAFVAERGPTIVPVARPVSSSQS